MQAGSRESQQERQRQWPHQQGHSITVPDQEEQTVHDVVTSQQSRQVHSDEAGLMSSQKATSVAQDQSQRGTIPGTGRHRPTCSLSLGSHP